MPEFVKVAGAGDVAPGSGVVAEVKGQSVAVFNVDGTYYVLDNTCVHRGGALGEGELEGDTVTCPWPGWQYDVKSANSIHNPSACPKSQQVKGEGSDAKRL